MLGTLNQRHFLEETTMSRHRLQLTLQCIGAIAWLVLQGTSIAAAAGPDAREAADIALQSLKAAGHSHPIVDTHIHF